MAERYLLTGCAGFIASKVADLLLQAGHAVVGVDNLNDAYDPRLKQWRLAQLQSRKNFRFHHLDITDRAAMKPLFAASGAEPPFAAVVNLAARAGVRPSVSNPWVYYQANCDGTLNLLDLCRAIGRPQVPAWPRPPASTASTTRCPTGRTPTRTGRCRPMRPRRRRPKRWPSPTTTCTASTSPFPATSRFTVRRAGPT